jgi:1-acyl-sn-glycerol-3-phosphate acyltransferase
VAALIRKDNPLIERVTDRWGRAWLWLGRVDIEVIGRDNITPGRSYVIVSNHQSAFDIMSHFIAMPVPIRYLAKQELFRIPILAMAMKAIGIVEVDRTAGKSVHEHINVSARQAIELGRSLIIYPEGTRPRDGHMRPFKKGAFTIAKSMELPIVPTAITGSYKAWRPASYFVRKGSIRVEIFPPIEMADVPRTEIDRVRDEVHALIAGVVEKYEPEHAART